MEIEWGKWKKTLKLSLLEMFIILVIRKLTKKYFKILDCIVDFFLLLLSGCYESVSFLFICLLILWENSKGGFHCVCFCVSVCLCVYVCV